MINRDFYVNKLLLFNDSPGLIKAITGVRGSGKTTLLRLLKEQFLQQGVREEDILSINLEEHAYHTINDPLALHELVTSRLGSGPKQYIFLDEVHRVPSWERAVNSLRLHEEYNLYITGSNETLLDGPLATILAGRYVRIRLYPLAFQEFISSQEATNRSEAFSHYLARGGMPVINNLPETMHKEFLLSIIDSIVRRDIYTRAQIRDEKVLSQIIIFLGTNTGTLITTQSIANYLTSIGTKTTSDTIGSYLTYLEEAYLFTKVHRFNIKGGYPMQTSNKYYICDVGLQRALIGSDSDYEALLQSVVFLELKRKHYTIYTGKINTLEVDFVVESSTEKSRSYIQVASSYENHETRERKRHPLKAIDDNFPKFILTMDPISYTDSNGIQHRNIIDFLLQKE